MDQNKIRAHLSVRRRHAALLDVARMPQFSGWVRVVEVKECCAEFAVEIAFLSAETYDTHGLGEGPITYVCQFSSLESALQCLEEYLGSQLHWNEGCGWDSIAAMPADTASSALGFEQMLQAINSDTVPLPKSAIFALGSNSDWIQKAIADPKPSSAPRVTPQEVSQLLLQIASSDDFANRSADLVEQLNCDIDAFDSIEAILRFMENHTSVDFGSPGPLVHFVEQFYKSGYEQKLLESILRKPTAHTVWMLNRLVNGTAQSNKQLLIDAMKKVKQHPFADQITIQRAAEYLRFSDCDNLT